MGTWAYAVVFVVVLVVVGVLVDRVARRKRRGLERLAATKGRTNNPGSAGAFERVDPPI